MNSHQTNHNTSQFMTTHSPMKQPSDMYDSSRPSMEGAIKPGTKIG